VVVPLRLLIVDDHERFRTVARRTLQRDGYDVVGEAADAAEGIDLAGTLLPDVVLLDVMLPDRSGLDVIAELRTQQPGLAVVLISTHHEEEWAELAIERGARGFLPKSELSGEALDALVS
jgi:DNA-binding NarL/FixJ family response regulator